MSGGRWKELGGAILLCLVVAGCNRGTSTILMPGRMDNCADPKSADLKISTHCIGPIAWDSTLGNIRHHFEPSEDKSYLEASPIVTWTFRFGEATIVTSQHYVGIDPDHPATYWVISGSGIVLPGGGHLPRTWGELRKTYSRGLTIWSGELGVAAESCQMPGVSFTLSLPDRDPPIPPEVDTIPSDTPIEDVQVDRHHPPPDSLVRC